MFLEDAQSDVQNHWGTGSLVVDILIFCYMAPMSKLGDVSTTEPKTLTSSFETGWDEMNE